VNSLTGVARLCGLDEAEEARLRAVVRVGPPATPPEIPEETDLSHARRTGAPPPHDPGRWERALAAADALFAERRRLRRPAKRILTSDEVIGLVLMLRGGPEHAGRVAEVFDVAARDRDDDRRRAYEAMVEHNTGLIHAVASGRRGKHLTCEDLVEYGVQGLMRAACRFDPYRDTRFSTYAHNWVEQALGRAIENHDAAIRLPLHVHRKLRELPPEERRPPRVIGSLDHVMPDGRTAAEHFEHIDPAPGPEEVLAARWERADLEARVLSRLTPRQADIVRRRIGLVDQERQTLAEVGERYGLTRERIRQIARKALDRAGDILAGDEPRTGRRRRPSRPDTDDFALAAARVVRRLGPERTRRAVGRNGALILCAIATHRLPATAASTRLREFVMSHPARGPRGTGRTESGEDRPRPAAAS
jgi:RNA polymerase primary sigma factor